jgi:N-acetylneuraminate synthase
MEINGREIGSKQPPYFIADIGANHDGSLRRAKELISMAAAVGTDAVKFQNFRAGSIVSRRGFEEIGLIGHQTEWGDVYDTYADYSMPLNWIEDLANRCDKEGVAFMTTPYDLELVDLIDDYVPAWKIGSGDITWHELIVKVRSKGKPYFLATGASTAREVRAAIQGPCGNSSVPPFAILQCNTNYTGETTNLRYLNLNVLDSWKAYCLPLGLSDHIPGTMGILSACAAIALGAVVIEKHFTDNPARKGPDHSFAMTPVEWTIMIEDAQSTWQTLGEHRKTVQPNEQETRIIQRRALRWATNVPAGAIVIRENLNPTRPCPPGALEPWQINEIVDKTLQSSVEADTLVRLEDLA